MKTDQLFDYIKQSWYAFGERSQKIAWQKGQGFITLRNGSLIGSWQTGKQLNWGPILSAGDHPVAAGLLGGDMRASLNESVASATQAGEWHLARLRSRQMALLGLESPVIGSSVRVGEHFTNGESTEMIWCPAGEFVMGESDSPGPYGKHKVKLSHGFWLGKYEVTQELYQRITGENPSTNVSSGPKAPVENLSWFEAMKFCEKLTDLERSRGSIPSGWMYSLPTEAQWEYACRAGTSSRWSFGDDESKIYKYANFNDKSGGFFESDSTQDDGAKYTSSVGQYLANPWGLHDMHGNVLEWCRDSFDPENPNYPDRNVSDPWVTEGAHRGFRGGSYDYPGVKCRSANRYANLPSIHFNYLGFRPCLVQTESTP